MNFLAHLFLSNNQEQLMVGNFIADFISNKDLDRYDGGILEGIYLHRKIDFYTDNHPVVRESTVLLRPQHRKYAPVLLDLYYDYLLIHNWDQFSEISLEAFTQNAYAILDSYMPVMPMHLQGRLPGMIAGDWLRSYGTPDGLAYAVERMMYRTSKPEWLEKPIQTLQSNFEELNDSFLEFFPDVVDFVKN